MLSILLGIIFMAILATILFVSIYRACKEVSTVYAFIEASIAFVSVIIIFLVITFYTVM